MDILLIASGPTDKEALSKSGENLSFPKANTPLAGDHATGARALEAMNHLEKLGGSNIFERHVAISSLKIAAETAKVLELNYTRVYDSLNESDYHIGHSELRGMIANNYIPQASIRAAEELLMQPPTEGIWITHRLLITSICRVVGYEDRFDNLLPDHFEIRSLTNI